MISCLSVSAKHVKGGFIQYKYNGVGSTAGTSNYTVTVTVFFSCTTQGPRDNVYLGVFNASTHSLVAGKQIATTTSTSVSKTSFNPCMSDPPAICYQIYTYVYTLDLADIAAGYILTVQDAYRVENIVNISNSGADGITIVAQIPGTINGVDYHINNSPAFLFKDTAIICYNGNFSYPFGATDADGDSISYVFGNGLNVTGASQNTSSAAPGAPPYPALTYNSGYSGTTPLGSGVTIDPVTGLISGKAPATTGEYVVAVYAKEWRKGVLIDSVKKELQIYVYNCSISAASLNTSYVNCDDYSFTFENESTSSNITNYYWDFGVTNSTKDTSTKPTPAWTYADTGTYTLKLKVSNSTGCTDSSTSPVKVYPGWTPKFTYTGSCYQAPFNFTDATYARYGTVDSWSWTFGEASSASNSSSVQDPGHTYAASGQYTVTLNVASSKGCSGSVSQTVTASDKPVITLPFRDTLICSIDTLQLKAGSDIATAVFSWTPAANMLYSGTDTPRVWPKDTTVYTVTVTQNGCIGKDSITVNVLDFITVTLPADTTVCLTDSFTLDPVSHALQYVWTPADYLNNAFIKDPKASLPSDMTYRVTANLGKCQDMASINIHVYPYPQVNAGSDTTICYGGDAVLHATVLADTYAWAPLATLRDASTLTPTASPLDTTYYFLTVRNTSGCPKPVTDTVIVNVIPKIVVFAGNDTSVVIGQPLQLHATSTMSDLVSFDWAPSDWLDNAFTATPVATIGSAIDSIVYIATASTPQGCKGTDDIRIKVFSKGPDIFMPGGFTPNGDGHNDIFRPVLAGISRLDFFTIYNRWGQQVFSTSQPGAGWDGAVHGSLQETGTYVYMVQGLDYLGKVHFKKGSFVLVR